MATYPVILTVLAAVLLNLTTPSLASTRHDYGTVNERPNFSFDELWTLHDQFYTAFMYPNNVAQAKAINSTLLAPNIIGRVDATRVFPGQQLNTEW